MEKKKKRIDSARQPIKMCFIMAKTGSLWSFRLTLKSNFSIKTSVSAAQLAEILHRQSVWQGFLQITGITALTVFSLVSCKSISEQDVRQFLNDRVNDPMTDTRSVDVFFASNRSTTSAPPACSADYYSNDFSPVVEYGICSVSVPRDHAVGALNTTDSRFPDRHVFYRIGNFQEHEEQEWVQRLKNNPSDEILVFVHGFNVRFDEAVLRASQLKYDIKFQGPVVLYSWPAGGEGGFLGGVRMLPTYNANKENANQSVDNFQGLFESLVETNKRIHLIVHSMGHVVVLPALNQMSQRGKIIEELVLNAPDYRFDDFRIISPNLIRASRRVTMYCSPSDNALVISQRVNRDTRAGMCGRVPGIDIINVREVDSPVLGIGGLGHGYYSGRAILTDLHQLLLGLEVENRLFIRIGEDQEDYILRK